MSATATTSATTTEYATSTGYSSATEHTKPRKTRKPGSGRPGEPRRKPRLSAIPQIQLVSSGTASSGSGTGNQQWSDREYEQLCFDLLHEQWPHSATGRAATARTEVPPAHKGISTELRLPDRTVNPQPLSHFYDSSLFSRQRTSSSRLPEAKRWCSQFTCAYIEVLNGRRAVRQIERWLDERTSHQVKSEATRQSNQPPQCLSIHSLHVSQPVDSVIEGSCLLKSGERFRVMTFRFEGWDGRWMCSHLRIHP